MSDPCEDGHEWIVIEEFVELIWDCVTKVGSEYVVTTKGRAPEIDKSGSSSRVVCYNCDVEPDDYDNIRYDL